MSTGKITLTLPELRDGVEFEIDGKPHKVKDRGRGVTPRFVSRCQHPQSADPCPGNEGAIVQLAEAFYI